MTLKHEVRTVKTINTINNILDQGIEKISVIIRHSDRFFSTQARHEPFMGLTDQGKDFAFDFGTKLRSNPVPRLCSSFIGRCIETAFLIDKGFTQQNNSAIPEYNYLSTILGPIYIKNIEKAIELLQAQQSDTFLRNWFDKRIDENVMANPEKISNDLCKFMIEQIKSLEKNRIALCVSHDWSLFPIKEFKMNLKHETDGDVGYLDALVFFEKNNKYYVTNYQSDPVLL